jgi:pimeloyl-ACP methyl ester carboxylesterase
MFATQATAWAKPKPRGPELATPVAALAQSLDCDGDLAGAQHDPVLLVHGTFADSDINWSWNYKEALPERGIPACTVDLPDRSAGDIQVSTEYVVYAIRAIAEQSGRQVAVMGFSQGGLQARWALRWWPDVRHLVSEVITLNTPNQGSAFPDVLCGGPGVCAASLYQMRSDSNFLAALNAGHDAVGNLSFTAVGTATDQVFVFPEQTPVDEHGNHVSNVLVQDLCPGRQLDHVSAAFDGAVFGIVIDALEHRGPADLSRIDPAVCATDTMPGVTREEANARLFAYAVTLTELLGPNGPKAAGEPPLACYATGSCPRK